jgi:hypothetical protein
LPSAALGKAFTEGKMAFAEACVSSSGYMLLIEEGRGVNNI